MSKNMIIYSVSCTVSTHIAEDWFQFFKEKHLNDVINTGYFTHYSFRKIIENEVSDIVTFIAEYYCNSLEDLAAYNENAAPILKKEVNELFGGQYICSRQLYQVLI